MDTKKLLFPSTPYDVIVEGLKQEFPDQPYNKMMIQGMQFKFGKNMPIQLAEDLSLLPQNSVRQLQEYIEAIIKNCSSSDHANHGYSAY